MKRIMLKNLTKNFALGHTKLLKLNLYSFSKKNKKKVLAKQLKEKIQTVVYNIQHTYRRNKKQFNLIGAALILFLGIYLKEEVLIPEMIYSDFQQYLKEEKVQKIEFYLNNDNSCIVWVDDQRYKLNAFNITNIMKNQEHSTGFVNQKIQFDTKKYDLEKISQYSHQYFRIGFEVLFGLFLIGSLFKKTPMNIMPDIGSMSQHKAIKFSKETKVNVKFTDVAGIEEAKREIQEFVDFLKYPRKFQEMGARIPKGALLGGPPGTGKTLLAKACAGESGVNFFFTSGSEFIDSFVGVGSSRVRSLFQEAKKNAPAIIFIDEIDAIGRKRDMIGTGFDRESDNTLNQLLVEMDGFSTQDNVVVFAATNMQKSLDSALTRPGRLDRLIDVQLPDLQGREQIFKIHLRPIKMENQQQKDDMAKRLAALTPGFSGADIQQICNEAAIQAIRQDKEFVTKENFEIAVERVIGGLEKKMEVSDIQEKTVAVHESGHGVVAWFLEGADPLLKLTIIPRTKGALGFAQYLPKENSLQTKQQLEDKIVSILAGRCAELEFFGQITTGAYDDFQKAYQISHNMVTKLGMSDIGYVSHEEDDRGYKYFSQETNFKIDQECQKIIKRNTKRCSELIKEHKDKIEKMSQLLLQKKTIDLGDIVSVVGPRPFKLSKNFQAYLKEASIETINQIQIQQQIQVYNEQFKMD